MNFYLNKYGFLPPQIKKDPAEQLNIIVVIPCFNEPDLLASLQAIDSANHPACAVEVIIVLNSGEHHSEEIKAQNRRTKNDFLQWCRAANSAISYHLIDVPDLPKKHAGVGLARKIGMDEAVSRFESVKKDGIIVCFDADSSCDRNYLQAIEHHFDQYPKTPACSIYFEHPIEGSDYPLEIYEGIINYELHLRYYKQCQDFLGLPYAYHTVGSSMAVRSSAYQKQGGMNKRKAGEDFYFLHKIIELGNFTALNDTCVIPSPRTSDRVPFGTGKAIQDWLDDETEDYKTYNGAIFEKIAVELQKLPEVYEGSATITLPYLSEKQIDEIKQNTGNYPSFEKRFYRLFDAFQLLKTVHYFRDNGYPNQPLKEATEYLDRLMNRQTTISDVKEQLLRYRRFDRCSA
ncbi:MAG: glycosyltransferase [Crocinitomicaceae bacterium]